MNNIVSCISPVADRTDCPYIKTCLARLNDRTITGCGMPLYVADIIPYSAVMVRHEVRKENEHDS